MSDWCSDNLVQLPVNPTRQFLLETVKELHEQIKNLHEEVAEYRFICHNTKNHDYDMLCAERARNDYLEHLIEDHVKELEKRNVLLRQKAATGRYLKCKLICERANKRIQGKMLSKCLMENAALLKEWYDFQKCYVADGHSCSSFILTEIVSLC